MKSLGLAAQGEGHEQQQAARARRDALVAYEERFFDWAGAEEEAVKKAAESVTEFRRIFIDLDVLGELASMATEMQEAAADIAKLDRPDVEKMEA